MIESLKMNNQILESDEAVLDWIKDNVGPQDFEGLLDDELNFYDAVERKILEESCE